MIQLLSVLGVKKTVLNGWSFGGAIAQKVGEIKPDLVSKLILTCSVSDKGLPVKNQEGK